MYTRTHTQTQITAIEKSIDSSQFQYVKIPHTSAKHVRELITMLIKRGYPCHDASKCAQSNAQFPL